MAGSRQLGRYEEINELMDRVRQAYDDAGVKGTPAKDGFTRADKSGAKASAVNPNASGGAHSRALLLKDGAKPSAFSTKKRAKKVVEEPEHPDSPPTVLRSDEVALSSELIPTTTADQAIADRSSLIDGGVDYVEKVALPAHTMPVTQGAVAHMRENEVTVTQFKYPKAKEARPKEEPAETVVVHKTTFKSASGESTPSQNKQSSLNPERTSPGFAYEAGNSHYDKWLKKNSDGADLESGQGAEFIDRERTKTAISGSKTKAKKKP